MGLIVLDFDILVLLGVDVDLFRAGLVLEADLVAVRSRPAGRTARLDAALRLVVGQAPRRHLVGVVDVANHNRLIGIAFEEVDDTFLTDARNVNHAPVAAGPHGGDAYPARTV